MTPSLEESTPRLRELFGSAYTWDDTEKGWEQEEEDTPRAKQQQR
jgi:hypothetical protein